MGASGSARRDGRGPEDGEERSAEAQEAQEEQGGELAEPKLLQKNGQISSLNGKADDQVGDVGGQAEDEALDEQVGQTDSVSQKDDEPETVEPLQEEKAPQVNAEKKEEETPGANEVTSEDKMAEEEQKQDEAGEVGFKKIFRFVGFKFTLKKDKTEKTEPVQLLTVKKEEGEPSGSDEPGETKEEDFKGDGSTEEAKEEGAVEEAKEAGVVEEAKEAAAAEEVKEAKEAGAVEEAKEDGAVEEAKTQDATEEPKEEDSVKEVMLKDKEDAHEKSLAEEQAAELSALADKVSDKEAESQSESPTSPPVQGTQSPLRRFFTQGIFSNLRKKASLKKPREEEPSEEIKVEEDIKEAEETTKTAVEEAEETNKQEMPEAQEEPLTTPEDTKTEDVAEQGATVEKKEEEIKAEVKVDTDVTECTPVDATVALQVEGSTDIVSAEEKADVPEGKTSPEDVPAAITTEAELLSSQEKAKTQGSPLKKLLTGTGLKKLSSKKKAKKEAEAKLTESGEQASEQLQSSTESAEGQKGESSPSSPEESAEYVTGESGQADAGPENESDALTSDGEKKKDGILPWASFKKLVTPKKRVKRSSESEDEGTEKPKSATLSSTDGAVEKQEESKPTEEEQKAEVMPEEPKKKMDTSVSWEALICVGSSKKRARKTSDSDDEAPKIEEEAQTSGEEHGKTAESPLGSSQEADHENQSSSEQAGSPSEADGVSTWESLKRFVTPKRKVKAEDKAEEPNGTTVTEQIPSDSEIPKEESSFSLKKLIPGRKKKKSDGKQEQVSSDEAGKDKGSAEEDSDTPAVVPLSEYELEQGEQVELTSKEKVEVVEKQTEIPAVQEPKPELPTAEAERVKATDAVPTAGAHVKADIDERSPSWISPSAVEDLQEATECITKQPLSDIPEEGDTIATPKSTAEEVSRDDTIAEDIVELSSEAVTAVEQVPEASCAEETTEMLSAVSRLTESPGTSGDMTPVQGEYEIEKTEAIVQEVVQTMSAIENVQSVTLSDVHWEAVAVSITPQVMESATKEKTVVLEPHHKSEAVAICTGLESQDIESAEEKTLQTSVESLTEVEEVLSTEIVVEDHTEKREVAGVGEERIFAAEVLQIKSVLRDPEPMAEIKETPKQVEINVETADHVQEDEVLLLGEIKDMPDPEFANVLQEQKAINVALVNLVLGESEVLEEPVVAENTPKTETEGPLETMVEESICAESADVIEVAPLEANKVQEFEGTKEDVAEIEHAPLEEVVQCVVQEVTASMPEPPTSEPTEIQEAPIAVVAPATEIAISKEIVAVLAPLSDSVPMETADIKDEAPMERIPSMKFTDDHEVQVKEKETDVLHVKPAVEEDAEVASTTFSAVMEEVCENVEDLNVIETVQVKEQKITEEHSTTTVHLIIQNVVEGTEKAPKSETVEDQDRSTIESSLADETLPTTTINDKALQDTTVCKKPEDAEPPVEEKADAEKTEDEDSQQAPAEEEVKETPVDGKMTTESITFTVPEQDVKMVLEAVEVETMDAVQSKTTEECVAPVGVHQEDVSVQPSVRSKQEIGEMLQDGETKIQEQQKVEKEGTESDKKAKGEEKNKAESQEEKPMVDIKKKTKSEEGEGQAEAEPKEPVKVAKSVVAQESQEPEGVEVTAVVTTGQTLICPGSPTKTVEKDEVVSQEESTKVETGPAPALEMQDAVSDAVSKKPKEAEKMLKDAEEEVHLEVRAVVTTVETLLCPAQPVEEKEESAVAETTPESTSKTQTEESKAVSEEPTEPQKQEDQQEATVVVTTVQTFVCPPLPTETVDKEAAAPQEKSIVVETEPESTSKTQTEESKTVPEKPKETEKQEDQHEATAVVTTVQMLACSALPTETVDKEEAPPREQSTVEETEPDSTSKMQTESKAVSEKPEDDDQLEGTAAATTNQTSPGGTQVDAGKDLDVHTKAAGVKKEESADQESTEKVKVQSPVIYAKGKVEVSEEEVIDHCEIIEIVQVEAAVEFTVETGKVEVLGGGAGSGSKPSSKDDVAPAETQEAEDQKPEPSAVAKDACELLKPEAVHHQEPPAGDAPRQQVPAQNGTGLQPEGEDKAEEKSPTLTESREEVKSEGKEVGEGQPATADETAEGQKSSELTVLKEALEVAGDVLVETVSEMESVSSELTAAS